MRLPTSQRRYQHTSVYGSRNPDGTTRLQVATTDDLKRVDIWALGMILFVLLNPCLKYPYSQELKCSLEKGESALQGPYEREETTC